MDRPLELVGMSEVCQLLGLSRGAVFGRRRAGDFPPPVAELASGPVWLREAIVAYCRDRTGRFVERHGVVELAREEAPPVSRSADGASIPVEEAAAMLAVSVARLEHVVLRNPELGGSWRVRTGRLVSVERDQLGAIGRLLGRRPVEHAVVGCE